MTRPDLVLHLGPTHDAIEMLRDVLSQLRPQLRQHGVAYVAAPRGAPARAIGDLLTSERVQTYSVRHGPCPTLISCWLPAPGSTSEAGADDIGAYAAAADLASGIIEATGSAYVLVLLHTQRQDQLMERAYLEAVLAGGSHEFTDQFPHRSEPVLDFGLLVHRLQALPAVSAVRVRPVEIAFAGTASFVDDVLDAVGLGGELDLAAMPTSLPVTASCTARGVRIAAAMNAQLDDADERASVRDFVLEHFAVANPDATHTAGILKDKERSRILRSYELVNRNLFTEYMPDLPSDSYSGAATPPAARPPRRTGRR